MQATLVRHLAELRPAIKREWEVLLRQEPPATAIANPDMLVHLMDRTLDELLAAFAPQERHLPTPRLAVRSMRELCPCRRNPLVIYFSTGELALRAHVAGTLPGALDLVLRQFEELARQEIETLCALCPMRHSPEPTSSPDHCAARTAIAGARQR